MEKVKVKAMVSSLGMMKELLSGKVKAQERSVSRLQPQPRQLFGFDS
jgi:hypothetical protein